MCSTAECLNLSQAHAIVTASRILLIRSTSRGNEMKSKFILN